jgi:SET domain-containing protein
MEFEKKNGLFVPAPLSETDLKRGLEVAKSQIEGLGLFAVRDFAPNDTIWSEVLKAGKVPDGDGPLRWTNHSDEPNAVLNIFGTHKVSLVALKLIKKGEEIVYNYGVFGVFGHTGHNAECLCGQPGCPGFFPLREEWGEKK